LEVKRPKGQKGVTLSCSEAEYVAMLEAVKEIRFIYYLLTEIGIPVKIPIVEIMWESFLWPKTQVLAYELDTLTPDTILGESNVCQVIFSKSRIPIVDYC
jgi:hypothetical protein